MKKLEEIKIICTLKGNGNSQSATYNCEFPGDDSKPINIKIKDINIEGHFRGGNINLALSPLAKRHVNHAYI